MQQFKFELMRRQVVRSRLWQACWPALEAFFRGIYVGSMIRLAMLARRRLTNTTFVGVTGSSGKTTVKDLSVAILGSRWRTQGNARTRNTPEGMSHCLLPIDRRTQYYVQEVGIGEPGEVEMMSRILSPTVGAITNIGHEHYSLYRSHEAVAEEKRKLIEALPTEGIAVLNIDDPMVRAMAASCRARVLWFGESEEAQIRATAVNGAWPERFSMTVAFEAETAIVRTRLLGTHWVSTVLAAIGIGLSQGLSLDDCAAAVATVEPHFNRMTWRTSKDGVHFLLDAWKAPFWSVGFALDVMRQAKAERKIIVLGTMSDLSGSIKIKYRNTVREALDIADLVVFTGPLTNTVRKGLSKDQLARLHILETVYEASQFVNSTVVPGDLVLLKGTASRDHLERVYLDRLGQISCWRQRCGRKAPCIRCRRQHRPYLPRLANP
jgi:UDP-N-acetylmuramyl pentapeptide synthase